ncbi:hypothetical protein QJS10_CPB11g00187 [Acorus calamus]|uniref:Myb-like domain-containing protein n=1 Tax=Acorus calamus TaxID=4465 RepID=A0AAV9DSY8_ACOCL|nr:hypothetical protein QJS10_CPB11g00187 [Acorus calamus]
MDFVEEEARPRFIHHSRASAPQIADSGTLASRVDKLLFSVCASLACLLAFSAFRFFSTSQTLAFLILWTSLSLLLGPLAPSSLTGGDVRVGRGEPLEPAPEPDPAPPPVEEPTRRRRQRPHRSDDPPISTVRSVVAPEPERPAEKPVEREEAEEEKEWTNEDYNLLKKQISRHKAGEPGRWEAIAEAFNGRHGVESVIRTAKSMAERRPGDGDSFAQFLKQRKPIDQRSTAAGVLEGQVAKEEVNWSAGEDVALLKALKVFPKDAPMRWEKITAAVPGKSKASCMRRVAELKRDFRSSKVAETED